MKLENIKDNICNEAGKKEEDCQEDQEEKRKLGKLTGRTEKTKETGREGEMRKKFGIFGGNIVKKAEEVQV